MKKILVEVCCGSADDVIEAKKAGADRVELNSDLFHGGLTPTVGSLLVAKRETEMKIMTMISTPIQKAAHLSKKFGI